MKKYLDEFQKYPVFGKSIEKYIIKYRYIPNLTFMEIGKIIGDNIENIDIAQLKEIFLLVEEGVSSKDDHISTIMATHLLEAFYNSISGKDCYSIYKKYLGENSCNYIEAYFLKPWGNETKFQDS
ncbi:hypothetical protein HW511_05150 [Asaia siamensis]|uniref:Uncharacterized protein n=1 Tax=Asaia siamensis TaxID=110479 RepID=A0ABQ1LLZ5_9PROT|nr:hypothetical protein [Asaia siamensis]GBR04513.1 hypothetical protein AA0323_0735 [Asaia siamensis NRIC 0323]GGC24587.1 hypothetical protein GCM10007207_07350 [Asaia siamensis]